MGLFTTKSSEDENAPDVFHFPVSRKLLIIFIKNPVLGKCKTRLAATIGDEAALEVYKFLLNHTHNITLDAIAVKRVYYSDEIVENDLWESTMYEKRAQHGDDLGEKMKRAFQEGFNDGFQKVVIIGSDLYDLKTEDIDSAFQALDSKDYVIGPSQDGGYYLLGMKQMNTALFENKNWGTPSVLNETLEHFPAENAAMLSMRNDIDVYEDLAHLEVFQSILKSTPHG